jgi:hypothetical protein
MGDKKESQRLCSGNEVPIETSKMGIIEGWEGKAKGMLQMLFERGRIDPTGMSEYTVDGRNDVFGNLIAVTSLQHLMEQLGDFQDEETLMQYHGRRLGEKVNQTPKCHPEMAGEGVEYNWAAAKGFYCRLPISEKRSRAKFCESVPRCLDSKDVLTVERQRMFSRRACEYMVAYHTIDNQQEDKEKNLDEKKDRLLNRSTADFDCGFVAGIVNTMKGLKMVEGSPK